MASNPMTTEPILEVTCPRCGRRTDRVQSFEAPVVLFLVVYVVWTHERVAGCPSCVRARLWRLFLLSIPMANVFFPIVGPFIFWDILASNRNDRPGIPPEYHAWERLASPKAVPSSGGRGKGLRLLVVLLVVIGVALAVFLVLPRLAG